MRGAPKPLGGGVSHSGISYLVPVPSRSMDRRPSSAGRTSVVCTARSRALRGAGARKTSSAARPTGISLQRPGLAWCGCGRSTRGRARWRPTSARPARTCANTRASSSRAMASTCTRPNSSTHGVEAINAYCCEYRCTLKGPCGTHAAVTQSLLGSLSTSVRRYSHCAPTYVDSRQCVIIAQTRHVPDGRWQRCEQCTIDCRCTPSFWFIVGSNRRYAGTRSGDISCFQVKNKILHGAALAIRIVWHRPLHCAHGSATATVLKQR